MFLTAPRNQCFMEALLKITDFTVALHTSVTDGEGILAHGDAGEVQVSYYVDRDGLVCTSVCLRRIAQKIALVLVEAGHRRNLHI